MTRSRPITFLASAAMSADGLSNREIGHRLYLSRRTVESHRYRVFPKIGVASRAQLSAVLGTETAGPA